MKFSALTDKYNFFIFDFDGVVMDTVFIKNNIFYNFFLKYGKSIAEKTLNYHMDNLGINRYVKFEYIYKNFIGEQVNSDIVKKNLEKFSLDLKNQLKTANKVNGFTEFISNLYSLKKKCYIISAAPTEELEFLLLINNLNPYFEKYYGSPKNKYENFQLLKQQYNIDLSKSIYFGDTVNDMVFAKKSYLTFLGVGKELKKILQKNVINEFDDINYI